MDRIGDYDYELPPDRIAQTPLADRAASKMLHLHRDSGLIEHRAFREIVDVLQAGDLLVVNETRVTACRLEGRKLTGARVEALLLREIGLGEYEALLKPGKRLPAGSEIEFGPGLRAAVSEGGEPPVRRVRFLEPAEPNALRARLAAVGTTPLPPYIREPLADGERYQTVYAALGGSAAAPTAGLHFTPEILERLKSKGVGVAKVSLDVSLDTFRPVEADRLDEHAMHGERARVPRETAKAIAACGGRVVAVGTTVVRTLESFAEGRRRVAAGERVTKLFIRPGFEFQVVDGLLTNFHMPRTTMLVLVSSLAGRDSVLAAYREALDGGYRFLSFGDAMLVL